MPPLSRPLQVMSFTYGPFHISLNVACCAHQGCLVLACCACPPFSAVDVDTTRARASVGVLLPVVPFDGSLSMAYMLPIVPLNGTECCLLCPFNGIQCCLLCLSSLRLARPLTTWLLRISVTHNSVCCAFCLSGFIALGAKLLQALCSCHFA